MRGQSEGTAACDAEGSQAGGRTAAACDVEGARAGEVKMNNDHDTLGRIKSTKIAILRRRWEVLEGVRNVSKHNKKIYYYIIYIGNINPD